MFADAIRAERPHLRPRGFGRASLACRRLRMYPRLKPRAGAAQSKRPPGGGLCSRFDDCGRGTFFAKRVPGRRVALRSPLDA
jgi:hypothetical protein